MLTHMHEPSGSHSNKPPKAPIAILLTKGADGLSLGSADQERVQVYQVWEIELRPGETASIDLRLPTGTLLVEYPKNDLTKEGVVSQNSTTLVLQAAKSQYEVFLVDPDNSEGATWIRVKSKGQGDDLTLENEA